MLIHVRARNILTIWRKSSMFYSFGHWPARGVLLHHGLSIPDTESWLWPYLTGCTKEPTRVNGAAVYIVTVGHKVPLDVRFLIQNNADTSTVVR